MKIVIAGGSGYLGRALMKLTLLRAEFIVLSRGRPREERGVRYVQWDGCSAGSWIGELEGADVLVNLTGRSVDCRYTGDNRREILRSRVDSVRVLHDASTRLRRPFHTWIQSSSATIYRHAEDRPMTEDDGESGSGFSVDVCRAWEEEFSKVAGGIRKVVLRTGIVLGNDGGAFPVLKRFAGFRFGSGTQRVSWIHERDWVAIVGHLISDAGCAGVYNCTSPGVVTNAELMKALTLTGGRPAIPIPRWLLEMGAAVIRTETELILKSRWVTPARLVREGFAFRYPTIEAALADLAVRGEH